MKILAFETTDTVASVALYLDGRVIETVIDSNMRHAVSVLPAAHALLADAGYKTADMDAFAADVGPGSFTGVRIGVCMANALGAAHKKPVIAVNALETLAYKMRDSVPETNGTVCALIDARNGNGYGAVYQYSFNRETNLYDAKILTPPCACVVSDFIKELPADCRIVGTASEFPMMPSAESVAHISAHRAGEKRIAPLYLKLSQAERMWNA